MLSILRPTKLLNMQWAGIKQEYITLSPLVRTHELPRRGALPTLFEYNRGLTTSISSYERRCCNDSQRCFHESFRWYELPLKSLKIGA